MKISEYSAVTDPQDGDEFVIVRAGVNYRVAKSVVFEFTPADISNWLVTPTTVAEALDTLANTAGGGVPPDGDYGDIVITSGVWRLDSSLDLTGKQLNHGTWDDAAIQFSSIVNSSITGTNSIIATDSLFSVRDNSDSSKIAAFEASGIATATTRTFTFPDASGTLALTADLASSAVKPIESIIIACSDETTAITTGTAKVTFRMPYAFTLTAVRASVTTAPTGAAITIDINESGTTILSTKLSIDVSEKTSTTAATPPVISDSSLADDAEMTIDFDQVGSTIAGAGVKVTLIGTRT